MAGNETSLVELVEALRAEVAALREENRALREENRVLREENVKLRRENGRLRKQVGDLRRKLEEQSRGRKRQAAPFRKTKKQPGSGRKPGRHEGHPPAMREVRHEPDHDIDLPLGCCPECGCGELSSRSVGEQIVEDIPEPRPVVTRYRIESAFCPRCKKRVRNAAPGQVSDAGGAAKVQLGGRAVALASFLKHRLGVSFAHISGLFGECFDLKVTRSGLYKADARLARRLAKPFREILEHVRRAAVVNADETGWPHAGANSWLWVFATADAALVRIRKSRGHDVPKGVLLSVGPGKNSKPFGGTLVTDGWGAYDALKLDPARRQQCLSHLINRAALLEESQPGPSKQYPRAALEVLRDALAVKTWQPHLPADEYFELCERMQSKLDRFLAGRIRDPVNARLHRFLRKHRHSLLPFLPDPAIPGTNNEAERAVRPMILPRKTCGGTRSPQGLRTHEATSSVIETCKRLGRPILEFTTACYRGLKPSLNLR